MPVSVPQLAFAYVCPAAKVGRPQAEKKTLRAHAVRPYCRRAGRFSRTSIWNWFCPATAWSISRAARRRGGVAGATVLTSISSSAAFGIIPTATIFSSLFYNGSRRRPGRRARDSRRPESAWRRAIRTKWQRHTRIGRESPGCSRPKRRCRQRITIPAPGK